MQIGRIDSAELCSIASQRLRKVCTVTDEISVQQNPNSKVNNRDYFVLNEDGVYPQKEFADAGLTGLTGMSGAELYVLLSGKDKSDSAVRFADGTIKSEINSAYPNYNKATASQGTSIDTTSLTTLFMHTPEMKLRIAMASVGDKNNFNEEYIANHIGNIGKNLDEAFSQGKFTQEVYDELNSQLNDYAVTLTEKLEKGRANRAVMLEEHQTRTQLILSGGTPEERTVDEVLSDRKTAIEAYLEKNKTDTSLIFKMIETVRYGGQL